MKTLNLHKLAAFAFALVLTSAVSATNPEGGSKQEADTNPKKDNNGWGDENPTLSISAAESLQGKVSMYPNPATDRAILVMPDIAGIESHTVIIYDVIGKQVQKNQLSGAETVISLDTLKPGIYFYTVNSGSKARATGKLIIK